MYYLHPTSSFILSYISNGNTPCLMYNVRENGRVYLIATKTFSVDYQGRFISVWSLRQSFVKKVLSIFQHFLSLHLTCCGAGRPPSLGPQTGKVTAKYDNQSYLDAKNILLKI